MDRIIKVDNGFNPLLTWEFEDSDNTDCRIVILTSREVTIIRKALVPFRWATRFGDYLTTKLFKTANNAELLSALDDLEVKLMSCELADSFKEIAAAIRLLANNQCCDAGNVIGDTNGGMNGVLPDGTVTYGTQPPMEYPSVPPEGYDDMAHFESQLCSKANALVDGMLTVIRGVGAVTTFNAVGSTVIFILGTIGLMVIAPPVIPVLVAAMGVMWLASGTLLGLALEVENKRGDIVCALVSGDNMSNVTSVLANVYDAIIAAVPLTGPYAIAAKTILMTLTSSDTLNNLLAAYGGFNYPEADCSDCNGEVIVTIVEGCGVPMGQIEDIEGDVWTFSSSNFPWGCNQNSMMHSVGFMVDVPAHVELVSGDQVWNFSGLGEGLYTNSTLLENYPDGEDLEANQTGGVHLSVESGNSFTISFRITPL